MDLEGKKVAVIGYGVNNAELPQYLKNQGAIVTICDENELLATDDPELSYQLGSDYLNNLERFEMIFRTPGLSYYTKELQVAKQAGSTLSSQTDLFIRHFPGKVIGVTGTKGKGTTASLIYAILLEAKQQGELDGSIYLAGNIGTSPLQFLDAAGAQDWAVLELSSFQLQGLEISPQIAVILDVTVDHLDYHRDEAEYLSAKKNIVRYQKPEDAVVLNIDSLTSILFAEETPAVTYFFSRRKTVDQGTFVNMQSGQIVLRLPEREDSTICETKDVQLVGEYNLSNITAAVTAGALAGASNKSVRTAITSFHGLPHRLELIATKSGIRYYDDSFATTPDAAIGAIAAFSEPITLIAGGSWKGVDYSELIETINTSTVTTVICLGPEGQRIKKMLDELGSTIQAVTVAGTMADIVSVARSVTSPRGIVLLSPAAASFDMFRNATDRGDQFKQAVLALPND